MDKDKHSQNKLFIGNIPEEVTEKQLRECLADYKGIADLVIIKDKHSKKSRGFGFVIFKERKTAKKVLQAKHRIRDRSLEVKLAEPKMKSKLQQLADVSSITKVFIGGIPKTACLDDLTSWFSRYGELEQAALLEDRTTNEQTFKQLESVKKALEDYSVHQIQGKWVECKVALPKSVSEPTTNANFTLEDSSSDIAVDREPANKLPCLNPKEKKASPQACSSPQIHVQARKSKRVIEPHSQFGIDKHRKKQVKPRLGTRSKRRQDFDFGDFYDDEQDDDQVEPLSQAGFELHPVEAHTEGKSSKQLECRTNKQRAKICSSKQVTSWREPSEAKGQAPVGQKITQWVESAFDSELSRQTVYRFTRVSYNLQSSVPRGGHPFACIFKGQRRLHTTNAIERSAARQQSVQVQPVQSESFLYEGQEMTYLDSDCQKAEHLLPSQYSAGVPAWTENGRSYPINQMLQAHTKVGWCPSLSESRSPTRHFSLWTPSIEQLEVPGNSVYHDAHQPYEINMRRDKLLTQQNRLVGRPAAPQQWVGGQEGQKKASICNPANNVVESRIKLGMAGSAEQRKSGLRPRDF
jgi:RNA recognition motif-containing protein